VIVVFALDLFAGEHPAEKPNSKSVGMMNNDRIRKRFLSDSMIPPSAESGTLAYPIKPGAN
jgi:hypothetical protein